MIIDKNNKRNLIKRLLVIISALMVISFNMTSPLYSQWVETPVSAAVSDQIYPMIVSDGSGGAIMVWQDFRSGNNYDIYAQRLNSSGNQLWTTNGVPICTDVNNQVNPEIVIDGSGGAIICWVDNRNSSYVDIYIQRVNSNGVVQWADNGIAICNSAFDKDTLDMISDGLGGAVITWMDYRNNAVLADIYAQRVNPSGSRLWSENGVNVCNEAAAQRGPKIVSDGSGGALITWYDNRAGNYDIYTQRVNNDGAVQWTTNGAATCTMATDQLKPDICSDGSGGAIITWYDYRSTTDYNIYAQRMGPAGGIVWAVDGVVMNNNAAYTQSDPKIVSDNLGGAIITWQDFRTGNNFDIYAQHVNSAGALLWTATGVIICTSEGDQIKPQIVSDGSSGAYITWEDHRNTTQSDIYAMRIASDAGMIWPATGFPICLNASDQLNPMLVADGNLGAIVTWQDYRNSNSDIYAWRFNIQSPLPVKLSSFTFIVSGNNVILNWMTESEQNNKGFEIEKSNKSGADNLTWEKIGFVEGNGTKNTPTRYSYADNKLNSGEYTYRLKQIDFNGNQEIYYLAGVVTVEKPEKFMISQNYPNPFNPTTKINFALPKQGFVTLKIYDITGREMQTLVREVKQAGYYSVDFNGASLSSGVYFYRIQSNDFVSVKRMVLIK